MLNYECEVIAVQINEINTTDLTMLRIRQIFNH